MEAPLEVTPNKSLQATPRLRFGFIASVPFRSDALGSARLSLIRWAALAPYAVGVFLFQRAQVAADVVTNVARFVMLDFPPEPVQIAGWHILHRLALVLPKGHRVSVLQCFHFVPVRPCRPTSPPEPTPVGRLGFSLEIFGYCSSWFRGGSAGSVRLLANIPHDFTFFP
jgi:hypothetical protein